MKNHSGNILPFLLTLMLQLLALILVWNLKTGKEIPFSLFVILFIPGTALLIYLAFFPGKIGFRKIKKIPEREPVPEERKGEDEGRTFREFVDPKEVSEKIFKNIMLKRTLAAFGEKLLQNLASEFEIAQGIFYIYSQQENHFIPVSFYAIINNDNVRPFREGEGISGQAVRDEKITVLSGLPENYRLVISGLGSSVPKFLYLVPFFNEKNCIALIELSTFREISETRLNILNYLINTGAKKLIHFREKINE